MMAPAVGNIVYVGSENKYPYMVIRVVYGQYDGQARVARVDEDFRERSTGFWTSLSDLWVLEVGDPLFTTASVVDASEAMQVIPPGTKCTY